MRKYRRKIHLLAATILISWFVVNYSFSSDRIDSLKIELAKTTGDSLKAELYRSIVNSFYPKHIDSVKFYAEELVTYGEQKDSEELVIKGNLLLTDYLYKTQGAQQALDLSLKMLEKSRLLLNNDAIRWSLGNTGYWFYKVQQYDSAANHRLEGINLPRIWAYHQNRLWEHF